MLENIIDSFLHKATSEHNELTLTVDPDVVGQLFGDSNKLRQVLVNLVGNAIKFTNNGRIIIEVQLISQSPKIQQLKFIVTDTGPGIAPENQERIFQSFTQEKSDTSINYGGKAAFVEA